MTRSRPLPWSLCVAWLALSACSAGHDQPGADAAPLPDARELDEADANDGGYLLRDLPPVDGDDDLPPSLIAPEVTPASLVLPPDGGPGLPELPEGGQVRATTWNVYGGNWATLDDLAAAIATLQADLVGLEECPEGAAATLADLAGYAHAAQQGGQALLSRTPLAEVAMLALGSEGRAALHATTLIGGAPFSVYVVHVSWNVAGNLQCKELADVLVADPVDRLVVMGDFNDEPYSTQITYLEGVLADVFTTAGVYPGQLISWPSHGFDETEGAQLIDLLFYRRAFPALVLGAGVTELMPPRSDHKPAWADLRYPPPGAPAFTADPLAPLRDPFRAFPPEGARPPNLLVNPGAEGGLTGWELEGDPRAEAFREQRTPHAGQAFFTGYPKQTGKVMRSTGTQTIDLAAHADAIDQRRGVLYASGWLATGSLIVTEGDEVSNLAKPYDDAEVIVQALGADGDVVLERSSGRRDTLGWVPWAERIDLPPGTREARLTFAMNRKVQSGLGNDGAVDDLFLGFAEAAEPHARLGADAVRNGGAEVLDASWWSASDDAGAFANDTVLGPWGGTVFPPWSWSGRGFFAARAPVGEAPGPGMAQDLDLSAYAAEQAAGTLAIRWGGWQRTFEARTAWTLALRIADDRPGTWGSVAAGPIFAAAWTPVESLTRIPPGATHVSLVWQGPEAPGPVDAGFVDSLFAWPEVVPSPGL